MHDPFEHSADLEAMREVVREFCAEQIGEERVRQIMESEIGVDRELWQRLGEELGLFGMMVPERFGGLEMGVQAQSLMVEELGAALVPGPLVGTLALAIPILSAASPSPVQEQYLGPSLTGALCGAVAVPSNAGRFYPASIDIHADRADGIWRLSGDIEHVADAPAADYIIVAARQSREFGLWIVDRGSVGLEIIQQSVMDQTRRKGRLRLDGCPAQHLATGVEAQKLCERAYLIASALIAAEEAGAASHMLQRAVDYASERVQFGRPIGSFQALKHRLADLFVAAQHAKSMARYAAWKIDLGAGDADRYVSAARSTCSQAFFEIANGSMQIFGGIGITWEHSAHLYLKRAVANAALLGSEENHRDIVVEALLADH